MKKKYVGIILIIIALLGGVWLINSLNSKEQVYVYGTAQEPGSLNPDALDEPYGFSIYQNIFNRLVKYTNSYDIVPDLAKTWEYDATGKKLTFHLSENVRWHDGTKFTAEDVKFTFDTIINQKGYMAGTLTNIERIVADDENTVTFVLKEVDSSIISSLSGLGVFIMPKHIYENTDWLENEANKAPVGTGPYKFEKWKAGESITLVKNEEYFGDEPNLSKVVFKFIPEENTAWLAWLNDEIDWYDSYPSSEVEKLKGDSKYKVLERQTANVNYLSFNLRKAPLNNVKVRQAFSYAIDREDILKTAYENVGKVSEYTIPSIFSAYTNNDAKLHTRDLEKAEQLLKDAGYKKNANGCYITVNLEYFDLDKHDALAHKLESQLKEVGICLNLKLLEYNTWQEKVMNNHDFSITIMNGNQGPTIYNTINRFDPKSGINITGYNSAKITEYIKAAKTAKTDEDLKEAFNNIQETLLNDVPLLNIIEKVEFLPLKSKISGHPYDDAATKTSPDELTYIKIK